MRQRFLAHVMRQRPAAARALRHHHLRPQPPQKPDRRIVDVGVQRLLRTTRHQRHPHPPRAHGREHLRVIIPADRRNCLRRHRQHRPQARIRHKARERPPHLRRQQRQPEPRGIGDHPRQHRPQQPVHQRPPVRPLDIGPRLVHQMHVMHARRTGRHAGKATQAPVDVLHRPRVRRPALLQHVLDQVDAPARAVQLIAQHLIGRASRRAEPAMHAGPQHLVRPGDPGSFSCSGVKVVCIRPPLRHSGSRAGRTAPSAPPPARPPPVPAAAAPGFLPRRSRVAWPRPASAARISAPCPSGQTSQTSPRPSPTAPHAPPPPRPAPPAPPDPPSDAGDAPQRAPAPRQRHDIPHPAPDRGTRRPSTTRQSPCSIPRSRPAR